MSYASKAGRARVSAKSPRAFGVCFRCGMWYNRDQLTFQFQWMGTTLRNTYVLVCKRTCLDTPQEQLRSIILPADPVPIYFPSVEQFESIETDYRSLADVATDPATGIPVPSTTLRITEDCQNRTTEPYGAPEGLSQNAVMPYNGAVQQPFAVPLSLLSVVANGTAPINVTCSKPHGLLTGSQISVAGLTAANGFFSVCVANPMTFSYAVISNIAAGSLLTGKARIVTALVGLPYGSRQIPQITPGAPLPTAKAPAASPPYLLTGSGGQITTGDSNPLVTGS